MPEPAPRPPRRSFIVVVWEALPHRLPWAIRLRWILKAAWRAFGFRCIRFDELPEEGEKRS